MPGALRSQGRTLDPCLSVENMIKYSSTFMFRVIYYFMTRFVCAWWGGDQAHFMVLNEYFVHVNFINFVFINGVFN